MPSILKFRPLNIEDSDVQKSLKMRYFQAIFVTFLLLLLSGRSLAIPADANIIEKIRALKIVKIQQLNSDCNAVMREIRQCQHAQIVSQKKTPYYDRRRSWLVPDEAKKPTFESREQKRQAFLALQNKLKDLQQNISAAEANDLNVIIPCFSMPHKVGQFGQIGEIIYGGGCQRFTYPQHFKIISIIDDDESLVEFYYYSYFARHNSLGLGVGRPTTSSKTVWLSGVSTKDLITGSPIKTPSYLLITGTQDYLTPNHAKYTVFVFEPLEIDPNAL